MLKSQKIKIFKLTIKMYQIKARHIKFEQLINKIIISFFRQFLNCGPQEINNI